MEVEEKIGEARREKIWEENSAVDEKRKYNSKEMRIEGKRRKEILDKNAGRQRMKGTWKTFSR